MPDLHSHPLSPLGQAAPHSVTIGPVTITEVVDTALASLASRQGCAADVATAAEAAGIPLATPGKSLARPPFASFWLGPGQWMIEAPFASHEDIVSALKPLFGEAASITEQTDAWVRLDISGTDLPALFERLCAFDLRRHGPGSATRSVIDHLGCYVVVRADELVSVIGPRSSAQSLHHALTTAARSVF